MDSLAKPNPALRILKTKLFIPDAHEELVHRQRLALRMNEILSRPLLLLSAPAGSGKTTLLASWLAQRQRTSGWVSLDERDNDPQRFWTYVIAALQKIEPETGQSALALLQSPQGSAAETILTELLNDAAAIPSEFLLVFDDYHVIHAEAVEQAMAFFLENLPPQMHVILASRTVPNLPLSTLRAKRKLVEIGPGELNFTTEEAAAFFNDIMKLGLTEQDILILEKATEGWAAGLQLAALALQAVPSGAHSMDISAFTRSFAGGHHYLFDYLGQEILERQPEEIQHFLMRTSTLERFNASLCEAVLNLPSGTSQAVLESLRQSNLFIIPLDEQRIWFRYHPLFSSFLRKRLETSLPAEEICDLHRRASKWFGIEGLFAEAVEHSLVVNDYDLTARWIDLAAEDMFIHSQLIPLVRWLDSLPAEVVDQYPRLSIIYSWALLATSKAQEIEHHLQAVEKSLGMDLEEAIQLPSLEALPSNVSGPLAEVACIRSSLHFNNFQLSEVLRLSSQVKRLLSTGEETRSLFNGKEDLIGVAAFNAGLAYEYSGDTSAAINSFIETIALSKWNFHLLPLAYGHLAQLQRINGSLLNAEAAYQAAFQASSRIPYKSPLQGLSFSGMGTLLYERSQIQEAQAYLVKGLELGRVWNQWEILLEAYVGLAWIELFHGNPEGASARIQEMADLALNTQAEWAYSTVEMFTALFAALTGNLPLAAAWAETQTLGRTEDPIHYMAEPSVLVHARVELALNRPEKTLTLLHHLLPALESGQRWGRVIEALVCQARALVMLNRPAQSQTALNKALQLAKPQGYVRMFSDAGAEIKQVLLALQGETSDRTMGAYIERLLRSFSDSPAAAEPPVKSGDEDYHPHLSEREREVLRLVADGATNQEISEKLFISLNTVKTHLKKILHTLGVENRTQAAARARELNLL